MHTYTDSYKQGAIAQLWETNTWVERISRHVALPRFLLTIIDIRNT